MTRCLPFDLAFAFELDALLHGGQRENEVFPADLREEPVDNGEGERQLERDRGAGALDARNLDGPAQGIDGFLDHVQAHAPARNARHFFRRGKIGHEDERKELLVRGRGVGGDQSFFDGLGADGPGIETGPVVLYPDEHVGPGMDRGEVDGAAAGLSRRFAHFRRFDPVVDAVSDQVHERVAQPFDDGLVQFGLRAFGRELDLFSELGGEVPHGALELAEGGADRQHADAHGVVPKRHGQPFHFLGNGEKLRDAAYQRGLAQPRLHGHQFADQVYQGVQPLRCDPDARRRLRAVPPLPRLAHVLLLGQGRFHLVGAHDAVFHEHFADASLRLQRLLEVFRFQVAPLNEDFAQPLVRGLVVRAPFLIDHVDGELAGVFCKNEYVLDGVPAPVGRQDNVPQGVAFIGLVVFQEGDVLGLGQHPAGAELPEFSAATSAGPFRWQRYVSAGRKRIR